MIKSFLNLMYISTLLFSSEQIVLVVSDDFNTSSAKLECYEGSKNICKDINVNIGTNGLGWGLGLHKFTQKSSDSLKYEGDKKAPIGVFRLSSIFGYAKKSDFKMPYLYASKKLICVDDSNSLFYNQLIMAHGDEKSFEYMKRDDELYKIGVVVEHNKKAESKRGSCIFLHIQRGDKKSTAGCTSMKEKDLTKIVNWLDKSKNPILVQIPRSSSSEVLKLYPQLKDSALLR